MPKKTSNKLSIKHRTRIKKIVVSVPVELEVIGKVRKLFSSLTFNQGVKRLVNKFNKEE